MPLVRSPPSSTLRLGWRVRATVVLSKFVVVAVAAILPACSDVVLSHSCQDDADCPDNEVCFIDGCGDPGAGIAIEVTPSTTSAAPTQDYSVGELTGVQDLDVSGPALLQGDIQRPTQPNEVPIPYTARVGLRLDGSSAVLPGVTRHYQTTLSSSQASYSIPVSGGVYTLVVEPEDPSVPPFVGQNLPVQPGQALRVDVRFPASGEVLKVQGTVLAESSPVTSAVLEVQALDAVSRLPVSQKSPVSASGDFALFVSPMVHANGGFFLQVSPRESNAVVPKKTFFVSDDESSLGTFRLGSFGNPTVQSGTVIGPDGAPISEATVYVDGQTASGATFSSSRVHTDSQGTFQVPTLPALLGSSLNLIAVPPPNSTAATVKQPLPFGLQAAALSCPSRLSVVGRLYRPDSSGAVGVGVRAEAIAGATPGATLPPGGSTFTNPEGDFVLRLEPGTYRLDFQPADLPRMSRFITLTDEGSADLGELVLSKGKRVTGTVRLSNGEDRRPAPLALVRFFRVSNEAGKRSAVLLDETYTDSNGRYLVLLPTR